MLVEKLPGKQLLDLETSFQVKVFQAISSFSVKVEIFG